MRVFLTGATGYIGSAVGRALAAAGHDVHALVRSEAKASQVAALEMQPVIGQLDEIGSWSGAAKSCSVLIHTAVEYSDRMFALDRDTMVAMLGFAASGPSRRVIYTSGVWVYGNTGNTTADESSILAPAVRVRQRLDIEGLVSAGNTDGVETVIIRPGCVYGGSGSLTATWFDTATKSGAASIVGDGGNRWAMIHRDDLADLYVRVAETGRGGGILNATDRSRFTVLECARAASLAAGAGGKVDCVPLPKAREQMGNFADCLALDQHVDSRKAIHLLGWQPRHGGFVDGVQRYFQSWKALQG